MANENMTMSEAGMEALRIREGAQLRYYNDLSNNCTYGIGTLVHHGFCTPEEMRSPVTIAQVNAQLNARVSSSAATVRRHVTAQALTQAQFDSLVSVVYNLGPTGARAILRAANGGTSAEVVGQLDLHVYIYPRDNQGRRRAPVRAQGLVNRRREEAEPFR
jgi:lysozyme